MKHKLLALVLLFGTLLPTFAQLEPSRYGDRAKADVKVKYVYTLEEALARSRSEKKPIFFNCFADWALPCHGMNKYVFSDQAFANYLEKNFVPLIMDVSKDENRAIAERFNLHVFAHYLVLDENANIIMRIVGGKKLPEFQDDLALALSPKTSLRGTQATYQAGKRDLASLRAYLRAVDLASDDSLYNIVSQEVLAKLKDKDYSKAENWRLISKRIAGGDATLLEHLIANKADYVKNNSDSAVNLVLQSHFYGQLSDYAAGNQPYDAAKLMEIYLAMQRATLPQNAMVYRLYDIAKLRGERKYDELIAYFRTHGADLDRSRLAFELTLDLPEITEAQKAQLISYLRERAAAETEGNAKHLNTLANRLERNEGTLFEHGTFAEAQAKAQAQGKLLFVDVFTTWCGPCKVMSRDVFPQPAVGAALNPHYVSIKIDAEKGEGIELAKKYKVSAFPTMLILNADGTLRKSLVGSRSPQQLIEECTQARQ